MSLRARVTNGWLRWVERPILSRLVTLPPDRARRHFEREMRLLNGRPGPARTTRLAGMRTLEFGPESDVRLLYFHGGGYVIGSPETHSGMIRFLCEQTGIGAILPDYPLAPEHPFPAAFEAAMAGYREISQRNKVILGGDSAGGGLALALLGEICRQGLTQPVMTFAFSPWTDLELTGDTLVSNASREVLLSPDWVAEVRDLYLAGAPANDPRASPLRADFNGAGPVRLWVGDSEILADDSRRMAAHLAKQGVDVRLREAHDLPHVWPMFPRWLLPEAAQTLTELASEIQALVPMTNR